MRRREFLKGLGAAAAALVLPKPKEVSIEPPLRGANLDFADASGARIFERDCNIETNDPSSDPYPGCDAAMRDLPIAVWGWRRYPPVGEDDIPLSDEDDFFYEDIYFRPKTRESDIPLPKWTDEDQARWDKRPCYNFIVMS